MCRRAPSLAFHDVSAKEQASDPKDGSLPHLTSPHLAITSINPFHLSSLFVGQGLASGSFGLRQDLDALMEAVAQQPVSVAIEADQEAFQLYKGGILGQECAMVRTGDGCGENRVRASDLEMFWACFPLNSNRNGKDSATINDR